MSGHALKRNGHLYKRMRKHAKELGEFTTNEIKDKINNEPAYLGSNGHNCNKSENYSKVRKTKLQVSPNRLTGMLQCEPTIIKKIDRSLSKGIQIWEWIGEEEE